MEDTRKVVVLGAGCGVFGGLSLTSIAVDECRDFEGDAMFLRPTEEHTRRHTGVAKDRRLARKKRAQKLARRR